MSTSKREAPIAAKVLQKTQGMSPKCDLFFTPSGVGRINFCKLFVTVGDLRALAMAVSRQAKPKRKARAA